MMSFFPEYHQTTRIVAQISFNKLQIKHLFSLSISLRLRHNNATV
jgi:hypothetical protein